MEDRKYIENRILDILIYTKSPLVDNFKTNLEKFNLTELIQIRNYLETWNLESIIYFFEDKKQEYIEILSSIKNIKKEKKIKTIKLEEQSFQEVNKKEIENINFDF